MEHIPSWYDYLFQDYGYEAYSDNYISKPAFVKFYTEDDAMAKHFWPHVRRAIADNQALIPPIEALFDYYLDYFKIDKDDEGIKSDIAVYRLQSKWAAIITADRTIAEMISIAGALEGILESLRVIRTQSIYLTVDRAMNEELTDYVLLEGDKIRDQGIRGKDEEELYEYLNDTNPKIYNNYDWYSKEEREKALAAALLADEDADLDNPELVREALSKVMIFEDEK